jgi:hypothetical protein
LEDEGRSKCEFAMIVAYRKSQFKIDSRQKKVRNYVVMKPNCRKIHSNYERKFKHVRYITVTID